MDEDPQSDSPATFVPTQFASEALATALEKSDFDKQKASFFVWLGGAGYRTAEAALASLAYIASLPRGSGVVFDYAVERASLRSLTALWTRWPAALFWLAHTGFPVNEFRKGFEKRRVSLDGSGGAYCPGHRFGFHRGRHIEMLCLLGGESKGGADLPAFWAGKDSWEKKRA